LQQQAVVELGTRALSQSSNGLRQDLLAQCWVSGEQGNDNIIGSLDHVLHSHARTLSFVLHHLSQAFVDDFMQQTLLLVDCHGLGAGQHCSERGLHVLGLLHRLHALVEGCRQSIDGRQLGVYTGHVSAELDNKHQSEEAERKAEILRTVPHNNNNNNKNHQKTSQQII
jgi:hypothetical protein